MTLPDRSPPPASPVDISAIEHARELVATHADLLDRQAACDESDRRVTDVVLAELSKLLRRSTEGVSEAPWARYSVTLRDGAGREADNLQDFLTRMSPDAVRRVTENETGRIHFRVTLSPSQVLDLRRSHPHVSAIELVPAQDGVRTAGTTTGRTQSAAPNASVLPRPLAQEEALRVAITCDNLATTAIEGKPLPASVTVNGVRYVQAPEPVKPPAEDAHLCPYDPALIGRWEAVVSGKEKGEGFPVGHKGQRTEDAVNQWIYRSGASALFHVPFEANRLGQMYVDTLVQDGFGERFLVRYHPNGKPWAVQVGELQPKTSEEYEQLLAQAKERRAVVERAERS